MVQAAVLAAGCAYHRDVQVQANGADGVLYFAGVVDADMGLTPLGATRTISVARYSQQTQTCHPFGVGASAGIHPQGGNPPSDVCTPVAADATSFESASCDGACTVTSEPSGDGGFTLHVVGTAAGSTQLHVALRSADGKTVWRDSVAVRYAAAARVKLVADPSTRLALSTPVLPGVTFHLPNASIVDADDQKMNIDEGGIQVSTDAVWAKDKSGDFVTAKNPGFGAIQWETPGAIARTLHLEVANPTDAVAIDAYAFPGDATDVSPPAVDIDDAKAMTDLGNALSTITITPDQASPSFTTRVHLRDGRLALPSLSADVVPATLGTADVGFLLAGHEDWSFTIEDLSAGTGQVTLRANGISGVVPLTIAR